MEYFAAIDVSLELSSVCVVGGTGKIVCEKKVASEPEALAAFFRGSGLILTRIGLEAGPLSQWLHAGLTAAGLPAILIETRHVNCGKIFHGCPSSMLGADPFGPRSHHHCEGQPSIPGSPVPSARPHYRI